MTQVIDPVCGMTVEMEQAASTARYQEETLYFCAPGCKKAFEKDPTSYVQQGESSSRTQQEQPSSCSCCQPQQPS